MKASLDFLLSKGFEARLIEVGIDGWKEADGPLAPKT